MIEIQSKITNFIGHRANSGRILLLYRLSKVKMIELDIRQRKGMLVVEHGPSEMRRATLIGRVFSYIDYKLFYRDPLLKSETLESFLSSLDGFKHIMLDLKCGTDVNNLLDIVDRYEGITFYISSPCHPLIKIVKERRPELFAAASLHNALVNPLRAIKD